MNKYDLVTDWELKSQLWFLLNKVDFDWDGINEVIFNTREATNGLAPTYVPLTLTKAREIMNMSAGSNEEELEGLLNYYWGYFADTNKPKEPVSKDKCKNHIWVDVVLFQVSHKRCLYCDIKKTDVVEDKK